MKLPNEVKNATSNYYWFTLNNCHRWIHYQDKSQQKDYIPGPQIEVVEDIEFAVSNATKSRRTAYGPVELATEGHIFIGTEENSGTTTKVYSIASYGAFGFENGIFTTGIPIVIPPTRRLQSDALVG